VTVTTVMILVIVRVVAARFACTDNNLMSCLLNIGM